MDTETTSPHAMQANLLGLSISWKEGEGVYIPVKYNAQAKDSGSLGFNSNQEAQNEALDLEETIAVLKKILESKSIQKIGQNIKYDFLVLSKYGVSLAPIFLIQ